MVSSVWLITTEKPYVKCSLQMILVVLGTAMLSACFIEGGGCTGPVCFGVSTEVCGNGLFCDDTGDQSSGRCPDVDDIEAESARAMNRLRGGVERCGLTTALGLNAVSWNEDLFPAADAHSRDMASNNFINANGSDGLGVMDRLGVVTTSYVSQSVAGGFFDVNEIINSWGADNRECPKINSAMATDYALACRFDEDSQYGTYWTLVMTGQ